MPKIRLINISGTDNPGVSAAILDILSMHDANVLDIGQSVIHSHLSLGLLIETASEIKSAALMKDLLFYGHQQAMQIEFSPVDKQDYENWVNAQGKARYIVTLLGRKLSSHNLSCVSKVVASHGLNIDGITRLSGRFSLDKSNQHKRSCVEYSVRGEGADLAKLRAEFFKISCDEEVDIAFQEDNLFRKNRRLIVFDMDSTLIQCEVIDELANAAGTSEQVIGITEAAMRGELEFKESFIKRLAFLKGLEESKLKEIAQNLPITEGAERLISNLKTLGYKVGILSGGFTYFAEHLQKILGVDFIAANQLEIIDGKTHRKGKRRNC